MSVILEKLKAETKMAKALYQGCLRREQEAEKQRSKNIKPSMPNKHIMKQLRNAAL